MVSDVGTKTNFEFTFCQLLVVVVVLVTTVEAAADDDELHTFKLLQPHPRCTNGPGLFSEP